MKKKIFRGVIVAFVVALSAFNLNFNANGNDKLSTINLATIEALAQEEDDDDEDVKYIRVLTLISDLLGNCKDCKCLRTVVMKVECTKAPIGGACTPGTDSNTTIVADPRCHEAFSES